MPFSQAKAKRAVCVRRHTHGGYFTFNFQTEVAGACPRPHETPPPRAGGQPVSRVREAEIQTGLLIYDQLRHQ